MGATPIEISKKIRQKEGYGEMFFHHSSIKPRLLAGPTATEIAPALLSALKRYQASKFHEDEWTILSWDGLLRF